MTSYSQRRQRPTKSVGRMVRLALLLLTLALLAMACGAGSGDSEKVQVAGGDSEPAGASTSAPAPTSETAPPPQPTETSPTVEPTAVPTPTVPPASVSDFPPIEQIFDSPTSHGGWPVGAGAWSSSSFSTPIGFDLPIDVTLLSSGLGRLEFLVGSVAEPRGWIHIVEPNAISRPTGVIPIDLVEVETAFAGATMLDQSAEPGILGLVENFDFRMDRSPLFEPFISGCFRWPIQRCIAPFVTSSGLGGTMLAMDQVHRLAALDFGEEGRLYAIASPVDPSDDELFGHATAIATSFVPVDEAWAGTAALDTLGMSAELVPAGTWVRTIGSTLLTLELDEDLGINPMLFPELDVFGLEADGVTAFLVHYDHRYDLDDRALPPDAAPWTPPTRGDIEAALQAQEAIFEVSESQFAGRAALQYDVEFTGSTCPAIAIPLPQGSTCRVWFQTANSPFYGINFPKESDVAQRIVYIEELGLLITMVGPGLDIELTPLLQDFEASVELTPVG